MGFHLTEEHKGIRNMVHDFGLEYLAPKAKILDEHNQFPVVSIRELANQGLMGVAYPEEYGGAGADSISEAIVVEEITYSCAATGSILTAHYLGIDGIFLWGRKSRSKNIWCRPVKGRS